MNFDHNQYPLGMTNKSSLGEFAYTMQAELLEPITGGKKDMDLQMEGEDLLMYMNPNPLAQQLSFFEEDQMIPITCGKRVQQVNKRIFEEVFLTELNQNYIDILQSLDGSNITEEDFADFYSFLENGEMRFSISKLPVVACLFFSFNLEALFKQFNTLRIELGEQGQQIPFTKTANFDDMLLLELFYEIEASPTCSNEFSLFKLHLQYYLANQDFCWFIKNGEISPLFCHFSQEAFVEFVQNNIMLKERIHYFMDHCSVPEFQPELVLIPMYFHRMVQQFTVSSTKVDYQSDEERKHFADDFFEKTFPLDHLSRQLFFTIKSLYNESKSLQKINQIIIEDNQRLGALELEHEFYQLMLQPNLQK